jgi:hypothetical protein
MRGWHQHLVVRMRPPSQRDAWRDLRMSRFTGPDMHDPVHISVVRKPTNCRNAASARACLFVSEKLSDGARLWLTRPTADDHTIPPVSMFIVRPAQVDLNLALFDGSLAVDLSRDSAHKACIATLAEEYHRESRHSRGALRRSTSSRELLGLLSNVIETLGPSRPASASRTPLYPSSSPEP